MGTPWPPFEDLVADLAHRNAFTRARAALGLGHGRDPRAVAPLIGALEDRSVLVRTRAAVALGRLRDPRAIEPLLRVMEAPDAAATAAAAVLAKFGKKAEAPLRAAYRGAGAAFRRAALGVLGRRRTAAISEWLIAALDDPDPGVRGEAARVLGVRKDGRAVERLIAALDDPGLPREAVVRALGQIGDPRAFEPLRDLLDRAGYAEAPVIVVALRTLDNARAVDLLHARLDDPDDPGRVPLDRVLAGMDLMGAVATLRRRVAEGRLDLLARGVQAVASELRATLDATRRGASPDPEDPTGVARVRRVDEALRDLSREE